MLAPPEGLFVVTAFGMGILFRSYHWKINCGNHMRNYVTRNPIELHSERHSQEI